jgi:hypothetical protein
MIKISLKRDNLVEILKKLDVFGIDSFTLLQHNESGIGYCLDVEFETVLNGEKVKVTNQVIGTESW